MMQRCYDPNHKSYSAYAGRGINVCERWHTFENFLADMGEPPSDMSIDRRDNTKGYSPENCRWATKYEQANNRRDNFKVSAFGQSLTLAGWARATGLSKATIQYRLAKGMTPEEALSTEPKRKRLTTRKFVPPVVA
jgi:hypothetical protein